MSIATQQGSPQFPAVPGSIAPSSQETIDASVRTLQEHKDDWVALSNRERISLPDLHAIARRQGFPNLAAVHSAILETNGTISMFKQDEPGHYHPDDPLGPRIGKRRRPRIR